MTEQALAALHAALHDELDARQRRSFPILARTGALFLRLRKVNVAAKHMYPRKRRAALRDASAAVEAYLKRFNRPEDEGLLACGLVELRYLDLEGNELITPARLVGLLTHLPHWISNRFPYPAAIAGPLLMRSAAPYRGLV